MFPNLAKVSDVCSQGDMEIIERQLLNISEVGLSFYKLSKKFSNWKIHYKFIETEEGEYWIQQMGGIKFTTIQAAELYAFLDFCNNRVGQF